MKDSHPLKSKDCCRLFYQRSLSIGEDQIEEDDELQAAKVVIDALQHQLVDIHHITISPDHSLFWPVIK